MIRICNIAEFEGVSPSYFVTTCGKIISTKTEKARVLSRRISSNGYETVALYKNGIPKYVSVHNIAASAYCIKNEEHTEVNHKDENKINNCYLNLEWCTHEYNMRYGTRDSRAIEKISGTKNYKSKDCSYYETTPIRRQLFKKYCDRQGWNFEDFIEVDSGFIYEPNRSKLYYYFKEEL